VNFTDTAVPEKPAVRRTGASWYVFCTYRKGYLPLRLLGKFRSYAAAEAARQELLRKGKFTEEDLSVGGAQGHG
jgi:hypothetical protein